MHDDDLKKILGRKTKVATQSKFLLLSLLFEIVSKQFASQY